MGRRVEAPTSVRCRGGFFTRLEIDIATFNPQKKKSSNRISFPTFWNYRNFFGVEILSQPIFIACIYRSTIF